MLSQLKNTNIYTYIIVFLTCFIFILNLLFPLISDDFCHLNKGGGIDAAIQSYMNWNGRLGELVLLYFGSYLTGMTFAVLNTLVFTAILFLFHPIVYARKGKTIQDVSFLLIVFTILSISTVFGSVFLWRAGAFNYAFALMLCMIHFSVFRYHYTGKVNWYNTCHLFVVFIFCILSFMAGMSSFDLGALGVLIHLAFYIYKRGENINARFYLPALFFLMGFLALYFAPGTAIRAEAMKSSVSLGQIISWVLTFEFPQLISHYLDRLGRAMYKTNYFMSIASLSVTYFIVKLQLKYNFIAIKNRKIFYGYLGLVLILILFLFMYKGKPSGDSFAGGILFANFMVSILAFYYMVNRKYVAKNKALMNTSFSTILIIIFFHCLMIIDASAYTIGTLPARRAYSSVSVFAAIIIALLVNLNWKWKMKAIVFIPLLLTSASLISIETWGLHMTNKSLFIEPMNQTNFNETLIIEKNYKILKAPQFYSWSFLSTNSKIFPNTCFAKYYGIEGIELINKVERVNLFEYINYISELE